MWDDRSVRWDRCLSARRPKKDGHYDEATNSLEYMRVMFGPSITPARLKPRVDDEFPNYIYPIASEHSWMV